MLKRLILSLALFALAATGCIADTLMPPMQVVYSSPDNTHLFLVQPGAFEEGKQTRPCSGTLFRIEREKVAGFVSPKYVPVWTSNLENTLSPKGAIVANDGSFVVTVNDYSANTDENTAVVIYDSRGEKISALGLVDIFAPEALAKIPESTSSVLWFFDGTIDSKTKTLELFVWDSGPLEKPNFRKLTIDLETGKAKGSG